MPVRTAWRMHSRLGTGSIPGIAASTSDTCVFGSAPNVVEAPENSLALDDDLGVDLEADHDLPLAGFAFDQIVAHHHFSARCGEAGAFLDRQAGVEHALLVEFAADQVEAERQALPVEPARHRHRRQAREARRDREHVVQIHRQRVAHLLAQPERRRRRGRGQDQVALLANASAKSRLISVRTFCALVK